MEHLGLEPDSDFEGILGDVRNHVEFHVFMKRRMWDLDVGVEE